MAKGTIQLTEDQKRKNALIMARLEAEKRRLHEETRALQQHWKSKNSRKRSKKPLNSDNTD